MTESKTQPLTLVQFPEAIIHIDGDAFFASVEQALHPSLKNRPVVTGKERGIIACASYEAKMLGINRGLSLWEAKKQCPDLVVLPSDYESYSLFSKRMFDIVRNYTPVVEESSIDEGFADISGMRLVFRMSYEKIARCIQEKVHDDLDISVSVGLSITKSLAKLASKFRKPEGLTAVPGIHIHHFLQRIQLEDVCGFGRNTVQLLKKYRLHTAYDFVKRPERWAEQLLGKTGKEIWNELRGKSVYAVTPDQESPQLSISKCKSFTSPSDNRDFVYAKLARNVESAFIKLRRHHLRAGEIHVALRTKDFVQDALKARLNRATSSTQEAMLVVKGLFDELFHPGPEYRCTIVLLTQLESDDHVQYELFEDPLKIERLSRVSKAVDQLNERYGKHKVSLGTSLFLESHIKTERDELPWRKTHLFKGENTRQRLNIPHVDVTV